MYLYACLCVCVCVYGAFMLWRYVCTCMDGVCLHATIFARSVEFSVISAYYTNILIPKPKDNRSRAIFLTSLSSQALIVSIRII